jgi:predicted GIY-YIG superfamily endonuclease
MLDTEQAMTHWVYILKCSDESYYTGSITNLERRFAEHQSGLIEGYTQSRRPVQLLWSAEFANHDAAFQMERKVKGWSRAKKEALIRGDWEVLHQIVKTERKTRESFKKTKAP